MPALVPAGNPDALPGQTGYIPTVDAVRFALETIGRAELETAARRLAYAIAGTDADWVEVAARGVIRFINEGGRVT